MSRSFGDSFSLRQRSVLLLLMGVFVAITGCEKNPVTTWSAEAKSPDGNWAASARSEQWGGPGNAFDATTVLLKQEGGERPPVEILMFEHDFALIDLKMTWISSTHLNVEYGSQAKLDFQAVKTFGKIEITTREMQNGATDVSR